jgi:hypothetical protein
VSDAFEKVVFRGRLMDRKCMAFLLAMEEALGYELTIVQGNYNPGGVAQSGGTHDGGGVVDLAAFDWRRKVKVAAELGAFAYHRPYIQGLWGEHVHLGIRDHGRLSLTAQRQQQDWDSRPPRDGLKGHAVWGGYHPGKQITFQYPVKVERVIPRPTNITKTRDELVQSIHSLGQAAALLTAADEARARDFSDKIQQMKETHRELRRVLKSLPKR